MQKIPAQTQNYIRSLKEKEHFKVLIHELWNLGIPVFFTAEFPDRYDMDDFSIRGLYDDTRKMIYIRTVSEFFLPRSEIEIFITLAHEYRHAIQHQQGKFTKYFSPYEKKNFIVGVRAEADAVKFSFEYARKFYAKKEVKKFVYDYDFKHLYEQMAGGNA